MMNRILYTSFWIAGLLVANLANAGPKLDPQTVLKQNYVAFPSVSGTTAPLTIAARFTRPAGIQAPVPAVIIVHGSGGVDERGTLYSQALSSRGLATLEIDMWAARGLDGGLSRPKHVKDTLPDVYAAIDYLKSRQDIDADHIGLIGFSWGGVVAMLMAGEQQTAPLKAMVANYPVCWAYNKVPGYPFTRIAAGRQLMILSGAEDKYDGPDDCEHLVQQLPTDSQSRVTLETLAGATHAFELPRADSLFFDPYAFRGKGGNVPIRYNPEATQHALQLASQFFVSRLSD
ncbi:dienelactone hydrolase family protein [Photobacterium sp. CCB-ST2H9]|uniref:dienelactone hydrolase family protein n=1 Tax=Photobacterium sp. CCB-ST2H9 TaxID=2912855 RepID=UPI002006C8B2|nr:dienelactone hydrolase family protein [Photobacterium sp. CCB-ST2H9]UTM59567.1 dienelactone hydrolase family protein [Photobacterium sp. CCB-ST2H9]